MNVVKKFWSWLSIDSDLSRKWAWGLVGENQTNSTASYWLKITGRKVSGLAGAEV